MKISLEEEKRIIQLQDACCANKPGSFLPYVGIFECPLWKESEGQFIHSASDHPPYILNFLNKGHSNDIQALCFGCYSHKLSNIRKMKILFNEDDENNEENEIEGTNEDGDEDEIDENEIDEENDEVDNEDEINFIQEKISALFNDKSDKVNPPIFFSKCKFNFYK